MLIKDKVLYFIFMLNLIFFNVSAALAAEPYVTRGATLLFQGVVLNATCEVTIDNQLVLNKLEDVSGPTRVTGNVDIGSYSPTMINSWVNKLSPKKDFVLKFYNCPSTIIFQWMFMADPPDYFPVDNTSSLDYAQVYSYNAGSNLPVALGAKIFSKDGKSLINNYPTNMNIISQQSPELVVPLEAAYYYLDKPGESAVLVSGTVKATVFLTVKYAVMQMY